MDWSVRDSNEIVGIYEVEGRMEWDWMRIEWKLVDGVVVNCEIGWCFSYISFPILHHIKLLKPTPHTGI